jgi:Cu+-exporting ATPase
MEARVSDRAGAALHALLTLAPATARKLVPPATPAAASSAAGFDLRTRFSAAPAKPIAAQETEVPVAALKAGDRVVLRPGDRVPVDGVVLEGESAVDEAMLTGESLPADKKAGAEVFAGTVNLDGRLVMRVAATGADTALAHIIAAVQRAQGSRAHIQRLGDRISNVFVPVIVSVALAAGLWWGLAPASAAAVHDALAGWLWHSHIPPGSAAGFIIAAAVLIVACPCAMGLATPAAIMAGANAAARRGILIRDGIALEKAGEITAIVFDKTGTLTRGQPVVAAEIALAAPPAISFRALAAALARRSHHPLSQAIAALSAEAIALDDWREIRGSGVAARLPGAASESGHVQLGSLRWLGEAGVNLAGGEKFIAEWAPQGATVIGLAAGRTLLGLLAVRDALKPDAAGVVRQLRAQGLEIYLLTGDGALTAAGIAQSVGIAAANVRAGARPEEKAEFVKTLQAQGRRVAFVGDGINDAPALTQADLGIAVSRASDIAREEADIILLKSEIGAVPEALGLARATLRTIRQNLFWAFFYNALGVPLAALGFISPVVCAAAMGCSDLIVIGNALRLLRWRTPGR